MTSMCMYCKCSLLLSPYCCLLFVVHKWPLALWVLVTPHDLTAVLASGFWLDSSLYSQTACESIEHIDLISDSSLDGRVVAMAMGWAVRSPAVESVWWPLNRALTFEPSPHLSHIYTLDEADTWHSPSCVFFFSPLLFCLNLLIYKKYITEQLIKNNDFNTPLLWCSVVSVN